MTTTATDTKLLCPECRRENEPERIYCHDCGTRLDRSAVRFKKEPIKDTHKRVKRMFDPQRAKIRALFFMTSKVVLGAGVVAIFVCMFLPADVPPAAKDGMLVSALRFDLEEMSRKHQPPQKEFSEEQVNGFVASVLKNKQSSLDKPFLPFKRAVVQLHERQCTITVERSLADYWSVFTTCSYVPQLKDGKLSAKIAGGRIGRLPIHPQLARYMGALQADLQGALERDLKILSKMSGLELHEKQAIVMAPVP